MSGSWRSGPHSSSENDILINFRRKRTLKSRWTWVSYCTQRSSFDSGGANGHKHGHAL